MKSARTIHHVEGYPGENNNTLSSELGSLRTASWPRTLRKTICLWNSADKDDAEFDCEISCDSLLVVIEVEGEYLRVLTENCMFGWIHERNTEVVQK